VALIGVILVGVLWRMVLLGMIQSTLSEDVPQGLIVVNSEDLRPDIETALRRLRAWRTVVTISLMEPRGMEEEEEEEE